VSDETASQPEYDGQCAFALSTGKAGVDGSADLTLEDGGKIYQFSNPVARFLWKILPNRAAKADETWAKA